MAELSKFSYEPALSSSSQLEQLPLGSVRNNNKEPESGAFNEWIGIQRGILNKLICFVNTICTSTMMLCSGSSGGAAAAEGGLGKEPASQQMWLLFNLWLFIASCCAHHLLRSLRWLLEVCNPSVQPNCVYSVALTLISSSFTWWPWQRSKNITDYFCGFTGFRVLDTDCFFLFHSSCFCLWLAASLCSSPWFMTEISSSAQW